MPVADKTPAALRPYQFHGLNLDYAEGRPEAVGECPWCGREDKFYVSAETGQWQCKVCGQGNEKGGGNVYTFLKMLWEKSYEQTKPADYTRLATDRKLLYPDTLLSWGACRSILGGDWLLPGYGPKGNLAQLYRYSRDRESGKYHLYCTSGVSHALFGVQLMDPARSTVYVCEGPWDGMALWESLRGTKVLDGQYVPTSSEESSLLSDANVIAAPGCNVFSDAWATLFSGKTTILLYDNDHPVIRNGKVVAPAGYAGMKRVSALLGAASEPPKEIQYLKWGDKDHNQDFPTGFDVRDAISFGGAANPGERASNLKVLLEKLHPIPQDWIPGRTKEAKTHGGTDLELIPCTDWRTLQNAWRKALKWTDGLDRALSVMLASIISTETNGEQLWVKIMGPPSCGKSTLCEALSTAKNYVYAKSTIRGFHSGYKTDRAGEEDHSLIPKIKGKTLILKDGDTLLQSPNLGQILSEARDIFDGTSRSHYRHGIDRNYEQVWFTWILCGTGSLRYLDSTELGARFFDCVIMDGIDPDFEREVNRRVAYRALRNVKVLRNGSPETSGDPDMTRVKQLTGGYVEYLRRNADLLLNRVEIEDAEVERIISMGEFVAMMRARPSKQQDEVAEREFSSRLVEQYIRLTTCLAAVLGKKLVDGDVIGRVRQTALDTARGRTLDLARHLRRVGPVGADCGQLAQWINEDKAKVESLLVYLRRIKAVERYQQQVGRVRGRWHYRLSPRLAKLYREVVE